MVDYNLRKNNSKKRKILNKKSLKKRVNKPKTLKGGASVWPPRPGASLFSPPGAGLFSQPSQTGLFPQPSQTGLFPQPSQRGLFPQPSQRGLFPQPPKTKPFTQAPAQIQAEKKICDNKTGPLGKSIRLKQLDDVIEIPPDDPSLNRDYRYHQYRYLVSEEDAIGPWGSVSMARQYFQPWVIEDPKDGSVQPNFNWTIWNDSLFLQTNDIKDVKQYQKPFFLKGADCDNLNYRSPTDNQGCPIPMPISARTKRLLNGPCPVLYHISDPKAICYITSERKMKTGKGGKVGGGVYFGAPTDTYRKMGVGASRSVKSTDYVMARARVWLGTILNVVIFQNDSNATRDWKMATQRTKRKHLVDVAPKGQSGTFRERDPEWCVTENELYWKKHGKPHPKLGNWIRWQESMYVPAPRNIDGTWSRFPYDTGILGAWGQINDGQNIKDLKIGEVDSVCLHGLKTGLEYIVYPSPGERNPNPNAKITEFEGSDQVELLGLYPRGGTNDWSMVANFGMPAFTNISLAHRIFYKDNLPQGMSKSEVLSDPRYMLNEISNNRHKKINKDQYRVLDRTYASEVP